MRPEASRLVYRIRTALKGESNGLETASLAWQYATEIGFYTSRLKKCLETDSDLEAYLLAHTKPNTLEALDELDFPENAQWKERCETLGWQSPPEIDANKVKALRDRFANTEDIKGWLQSEYRSQARSKQMLQAFRIAQVLANQFGEQDPKLAGESDRLKAQVLNQAESELAASIQELMPAEQPESIAVRYIDAGLEIPKIEGPFGSVLKRIADKKIADATKAVKALIQQAESAETEEGKSNLEKAYLRCDYDLTIDDTRSKIEPSLRGAYSKVATKISHHRSSVESTILLRNAIDDLRKVLQGVSISFGRKKATVHDAKERLKSLQSQAKKMGRRISPELQEDIRKALSEANRKRAPKYAIIGGGGIAAILAIAWIVNTQVQDRKEAETLQTATAAINQAAARQNVPQAQSALREWSQLIASAPEGHSLKLAAASLENWIDEQQSLQEAYSQIADRLDEIKSISGVDPNAGEINALLDKAKSTRESLDIPEPKDVADRIAQFEVWRQDRAEQIESDRKNALLAYLEKAQDSLTLANAADDARQFESRSRAVVESVSSARQFLSKHPELDPNDLQSRNLQRIEDSLRSIQNKRDTMEAAQKSITGAKDLASYLQSLEAIYNFDTLPPEGKRNIGRILRLENEYDSLLQALILPGSDEGWFELNRSSDFSSSKIELDEAEKAFVQRLIDDTLFPSIYESNVKYFEGAPVARNEYSVFLREPVRKGDAAGLKTGVNFSFEVWGFNEDGVADEAAQEINFLSHPDGTFWGFFYEPSELSKESIYFQESLRLSLMRVLAGGERFSPLKLIDELTRLRTLSPAFRAYWQQQLVAFIELNPWKWGLPLTPSLAMQKESLESISPDGIDKRQWLSSVEQISPSVQLTEHFRISSKTNLADEARTFATFYSLAMKGTMNLIGQADESGKIEYNDSSHYENDTHWIVNGLTGRIEPLTDNAQVAPYSPVLAYRYQNQGASRLVQQTRAQTGWDLSLDRYEDYLPPLLK